LQLLLLQLLQQVLLSPLVLQTLLWRRPLCFACRFLQLVLLLLLLPLLCCCRTQKGGSSMRHICSSSSGGLPAARCFM
jgi:hypothetical protein